MPPTPSETNISFDLAWAKQSLGFAIEGNDFDHRQTLRRLAEADFHAPPMLVEAAMIVSGKSPQGSIARRGEYIDFAGKAVDDFCKQFFKLAPDAREREFEAVSKLAKIFPPHNERLRSLLPLLDVSAGSVAMRLETTAKELAKHLIRLATMSPTERAIERRQLVTTMLRDADRWQAAAAEIETRASEFMSLDPAFFRQVRSLSNREKAILAGKRRIVRAYKPVQPSVPQAAGGKSAGSRVAVVVLIIFSDGSGKVGDTRRARNPTRAWTISLPRSSEFVATSPSPLLPR
jgi:hypothetical protein